VTSNYTYDALYELTQVTQGANTTESYTYDPVGNRLSSLGGSPYVNNTSNELTSTPNASYIYDYNGNTTSKTDSSGTTNYTWDYENRLASVTLPGTSGSITFKYDPLGRRIQKAFTQNSTTTTINYLYDGSNAVADIDQNGSVLSRYAETQNIDEPLAQLRSGATTYYEADGLGPVTSLTSGAGAIANSYTYDSFGKLTASTGSVTNRFQYTAREFDSESGLYYYRARYYDSNAGRFLGEDPLRFDEGMDFYTYAKGSPQNYADPTGLFGQEDIWKAWRHYCDGSGTPWRASFGSINWGSLQNTEIARVKGMVGGSCSERTVPVSFNINAQAEGADKLIIGRHVVRVQGQLKVHCDCTWDFIGDLSSAEGYDVYQFYPSDRGIVGETETWIGGHGCKGTPFRIYLPGSTSGSASGKIAGKPTCDCDKK